MHVRVDSLTHGSYCRAGEEYPELWKVVRHVEGYTVVELYGDQEFPRQQMISASVMVWVDPAGKGTQWKDASELGAYSMALDEEEV